MGFHAKIEITNTQNIQGIKKIEDYRIDWKIIEKTTLQNF